MNLYLVSKEYNEFIFQFEQKVAIIAGSKERRPFLGKLIQIDELIYVAPLSSPKIKHEKMQDRKDFIKIKKGELGVINLNNMIPVNKKYLTKIEIKKISNRAYANLLKKQLYWCKEHEEEIIKKANQVYNEEQEFKNPIQKRCCNFRFIERQCMQYERNYYLQEYPQEYLCA